MYAHAESSQTTFSVYNLATSTMLHERVCVVETPADTEQTSTTVRQLIKTMRALDGVIFAHLKNPNRSSLLSLPPLPA